MLTTFLEFPPKNIDTFIAERALFEVLDLGLCFVVRHVEGVKGLQQRGYNMYTVRSFHFYHKLSEHFYKWKSVRIIQDLSGKEIKGKEKYKRKKKKKGRKQLPGQMQPRTAPQRGRGWRLPAPAGTRYGTRCRQHPNRIRSIWLCVGMLNKTWRNLSNRNI